MGTIPTIRVRPGETLDRIIRWTDSTGTPVAGLAGADARMEWRDPDTDELVLALSTEDGTIQIDPATASFRLTMPAEDTEELESGRLVTDLLVRLSDGRTVRLRTAYVFVERGVTRWPTT